MIGFYDYTVVLTYISLMCSVFGITQAIGGHYRTAIICLALSGLFDMFDGKIARTKKNRTDDEKLFGVQIDSLCDVVCFGNLLCAWRKRYSWNYCSGILLCLLRDSTRILQCVGNQPPESRRGCQ